MDAERREKFSVHMNLLSIRETARKKTRLITQTKKKFKESPRVMDHYL